MPETWHRTRKQVLDRDGHECQHCGQEELGRGGLGLHVHHIKKRDAGGRDHASNLITLCKDCHNKLHRITQGDVRDPQALGQVQNDPRRVDADD